MLPYGQMVSRQRKFMLFLLAFLVVGWGFTPYQYFFLSILIGAILSFYNLWLLQRKIDKLGEAIEYGRTARSLGTFTRLATAVLAVMIAIEFEDQLSIIGIVIGLMTSYLVIMIEFFLQIIQSSDRK
ncbi:ATP synthase subunit I [Bacillaceae bacterium S4-13-58]